MENTEVVVGSEKEQERRDKDAILLMQGEALALLRRIAKDNVQFMTEGLKFYIKAKWEDPSSKKSFLCFGGNEQHPNSSDDRDNDHVKDVFIRFEYKNDRDKKRDDLEVYLSLETSDAFTDDPSTDKPYTKMSINLRATELGKKTYALPKSDVVIPGGFEVPVRPGVFLFP